MIQRNLENTLASLLLEGKINDGETVAVSAGDKGLVINGEIVQEQAA